MAHWPFNGQRESLHETTDVDNDYGMWLLRALKFQALNQVNHECDVKCVL